MNEQVVKALVDIRDKFGEGVFDDTKRFKASVSDLLPGSDQEIKRIRKRLIETVELGAYNRLKQAAVKDEIRIECQRLVHMLGDEGIDIALAQEIIQSLAALFIPQLTFFFIIDTSESMAGAKCGAVNHAFEEIIPEIRNISENCDVQIKIAVMMFSSGCQWMYPQTIPIENFCWKDIYAEGATRQQGLDWIQVRSKNSQVWSRQLLINYVSFKV